MAQEEFRAAMINERRALALGSFGAATKAECGASARDDPGSNRPGGGYSKVLWLP